MAIGSCQETSGAVARTISTESVRPAAATLAFSFSSDGATVTYRSAVPSLPSCGSIDQTRAVGPDDFQHARQHHRTPAAVAADLDDRPHLGELGEGMNRRADEQVGLVVVEPTFDPPHSRRIGRVSTNGGGRRPGRTRRRLAVVLESAADVLAQRVFVPTRDRVGPEDVRPVHRGFELLHRVRRSVSHEVEAARVGGDAIAQERDQRRQDHLFGGPDLGVAEDLGELLVFVEEPDEVARRLGREDGRRPETPVDELRFPVGEAPQKRPPELDFGVRDPRRLDLRGRPLVARESCSASRPRLFRQHSRQSVRVSRPHRELVGIDDGERVERQMRERVSHAVEREVVQPAPSHRPRRRVQDHAEALEREGADQELRVRAAVVQDHRRSRVEVPQVADQVDDTLQCSRGPGTRTRCGIGRRRRRGRGRTRASNAPSRDGVAVARAVVGVPVLAQQLTNLLDRMRLPAGAARLLGGHVLAVDDADVDRGIRHRDHPARVGTPHEVRVLAHIDLLEAMTIPEVSGVEQRAAREPRPLTVGVGVRTTPGRCVGRRTAKS